MARKKKRTSVRKLKESTYILQEEEDVEATELVTRDELRFDGDAVEDVCVLDESEDSSRSAILSEAL